MGYLKKGYITQSYVNEIERRIYNDIPIKGLLDKANPILKADLNVLKSSLKRGEKVVRLTNGFEHVVVTSMGRVFNGVKITQYVPRVGKSKFYLYISMNGNNSSPNQMIDLEKEFEKKGWSYSYSKILNTYKRYKWGFREA
tara:strand:+ start:1307 stop:1729 length:423 start_codon:yes stop_codon:yes gene_type:complete